MSDRRVPPGGGIVIGLVLGLLMWAGIAALAAAQENDPNPSRFEIAVDTAGIMPVAPDVYATWIFARESPKHHPVSGILVAFDCQKQKVARMAQVKYELQPDGSIGGAIQEMPMLQWVPVTNPRMFALVCSIGPTHPESVVKPTTPRERPRNPYSDA
jgi:hypothetical protein